MSFLPYVISWSTKLIPNYYNFEGKIEVIMNLVLQLNSKSDPWILPLPQLPLTRIFHCISNSVKSKITFLCRWRFLCWQSSIIKVQESRIPFREGEACLANCFIESWKSFESRIRFSKFIWNNLFVNSIFSSYVYISWLLQGQDILILN